MVVSPPQASRVARISSRSTASMISVSELPICAGCWPRIGGRQAAGVEQLAVLEEEGGAGDLVLQLAHVARPAVAPQGAQRGPRDAADADAQPPGLFGEEEGRQVGDVRAAAAERRQLDLPGGDAVVEVGPEGAFGDHLLDRPVGRRDDPAAGRPRGRAAHPEDLLLLQHAQDLGLGLGRHVADLVEEEGALVGLLEFARPGVDPGGHAFSTPKSSASSRSRGSEAQLIATTGCEARGEAEWMNRASTSLPVPDSP